MCFHAFRAAKLKLVTNLAATATRSPDSSRRTNSLLPRTSSTTPRVNTLLCTFSLTLSPTSGSINIHHNRPIINCNKFFRLGCVDTNLWQVERYLVGKESIVVGGN